MALESKLLIMILCCNWLFFLIALVKKGFVGNFVCGASSVSLFTSSLNCCQSVCQVKLIKIGLLKTYRHSIWMIIYWEKSVGHFFSNQFVKDFYLVDIFVLLVLFCILVFGEKFEFSFHLQSQKFETGQTNYLVRPSD